MLKKIDHIGLAVTDLNKMISVYEKMGFRYLGQETVAEQKVITAFFEIGDCRLELLSATDPTSPIAKFIEKNSGFGGIQHLAIQVEHLEKAIQEMKEKGFQMIDEVPRVGAHQNRIAFMHPKSTGGILLELCQHVV
ncbi:MAG: methylmalonyl-CoA epimerase [Planctomycetota bacterium]